MSTTFSATSSPPPPSRINTYHNLVTEGKWFVAQFLYELIHYRDSSHVPSSSRYGWSHHHNNRIRERERKSLPAITWAKKRIRFDRSLLDKWSFNWIFTGKITRNPSITNRANQIDCKSITGVTPFLLSPLLPPQQSHFNHDHSIVSYFLLNSLCLLILLCGGLFFFLIARSSYSSKYHKSVSSRFCPSSRSMRLLLRWARCGTYLLINPTNTFSLDILCHLQTIFIPFKSQNYAEKPFFSSS